MLGFGILAVLAACGAAYFGFRQARNRPHPWKSEPFPPYDWFYEEEALEPPPPPGRGARTST